MMELEVPEYRLDPRSHRCPKLPVALLESEALLLGAVGRYQWWPPPGADSHCHPQLDDFVGAHPDYNEEEEEHKFFRRKRLGVIKNVLAASLAGTLTYGVYLGLLQMQLILHYDETYREVKYSNIQLEDIDRKVLMGINITPIAAVLYTPPVSYTHLDVYKRQAPSTLIPIQHPLSPPSTH
ncbi:hypothetical protein AAES_28441 [Amazona aestiva]|uniref:Uncharacterized protein n=1 Tax=Amazona aestiva TaxID=12930 RepID=A0A0Q3SL62_AMAAE|nr:hypothetical protein AAES_28441 [Amazona aestiva]